MNPTRKAPNKGERNGNATLTEEEVRHIRWMLDTRQANAPAIARMYLVGVETIRRIGRRETWNHLPDQEVLKSEDALEAAAKASFEKLKREHPELVPAGGSATAKMAAAATALREQDQRGDKLINELKGGTDGTDSTSE